MKVIDDLYTYGITENKLKKIVTKLKKKKKVTRLYVLTLPLLDDGILEVYSYNQLLQPFYKNYCDVCVVGVAANKDGAMELVTNVIQDTYDAGYDFDVKGFLGI